MNRDNRTVSEVLNDLCEAKAFGVYVLAVKGKPNEYAVCWSDQFRPGIAKTFAQAFKPPTGDGRVWAGESEAPALRFTPHVKPSSSLARLKFSFINKNMLLFKDIEPLIKPEHLIHLS